MFEAGGTPEKQLRERLEIPAAPVRAAHTRLHSTVSSGRDGGSVRPGEQHELVDIGPKNERGLPVELAVA